MKIIEVRKLDGRVKIESSTYPSGVLHIGDTKYPNIGVEYMYLQYSDAAWYKSYYVDLNNSMHALTPNMVTKLTGIVDNWSQDFGQEGNPTKEQIDEKANAIHKKYLADTDWYVLRLTETGTAIPAEITELRKQARLAIV